MHALECRKNIAPFDHARDWPASDPDAHYRQPGGGRHGHVLVPQSVSNLMRAGVEYRALADATPQVDAG
jgi:hypothetical protein